MANEIRPSKDVVSRRVGDEIVLVNLQSEEMYSLNPTGARAWELLGEGHDQDAIEASLSDEYEIDLEEVRQELESALRGARARSARRTGVTTGAVEAGAAETRYVPWLLRFRRTGRGEAELRLERVDKEAGDPRASTATFEVCTSPLVASSSSRAQLARELGLEPVPEADAELVLHAYRRWGQDGIRRLRGIFAVFIWDADRKRLLAARDQLGPEPLFYARAGDEWLFAPSPNTLFAQPGVPRAPNPAVLIDAIYWQWPFPEETSLKGIYRVLPGHVLTVTDARATSTRYWKPFEELEERGWVTADEFVEFDRLLERSVSECLDLGPCGIFLSGGLDSVSIAAVALDLTERRGLTTPLALSLAFPTPSEESVQRGVATALGLTQIMLGLADSIAPDGFVRRGLDLSADWPLPRTFLWAGPYLELARRGAENGVEVILTGNGGDEWLTVDLKLAADFIQARQFGSLYRFTRSKMDSFSVPTLPALRYLLWQSGLREVLRLHMLRLLEGRMPALLWARRRRMLERTELQWVAPGSRASCRSASTSSDGDRTRHRAAENRRSFSVLPIRTSRRSSTTRSSLRSMKATTRSAGAPGSSSCIRTGTRTSSRSSIESRLKCSSRAASRRASSASRSPGGFRASASSVSGRWCRPTTTMQSSGARLRMRFARLEAVERWPSSGSSTERRSTP